MQDQEEDLVRELMQADDVDAVLARVEGDHFRHLSPVMRKLSSFDGPRQQQRPAASPPPHPSYGASPATSNAAGQRHQGPPPPPPPPEPEPEPDPVDPRKYGGGGSRQGWAGGGLGRANIRDEQPIVPPFAQSAPYRGGADDGVAGDFSPAARPPPPPPPYLSREDGVDPLENYRRPTTATVQEDDRRSRGEPFDPDAESRYSATMDSWLKPVRGLPPDVSRGSPTSTTQRTNPFAPTRPPTLAVPESSSLWQGETSMLPPPTPSSPWESSGGRYHGTGVGDNDDDNVQRFPRITTTTTTTTGLSPPRPSASRGRADIGELENASQSRIARQLQLLRNYRELAELCSNTKDPSVDLFRSLPAEELARMQAEQLQSLPQREQSPITVNNNYYFNGASSRRGSGGHGEHSPGRSGRGRINSSDTVGAPGKTGAGPAAGVVGGGNSRSASELFTVDSRQGLTSHYPSGGSSSQPPRPPLLPSPRMVPLQSPQPSSGPDSPVATPPLPPRGGATQANIINTNNNNTSNTAATTVATTPPPLAPPSPSRSYRARSHRSRPYDQHYTPTATTEEAGSSYDDDDDVDGAEDEEYAGDFLDNDDDDDDDGMAQRPPPPRIIEREQHRRFPNNSANGGGGGGDYSTSSAQPPLPLMSSQQQQQQQQSQHGNHPGDLMSAPCAVAANDFSAGLAGTGFPSNARNSTAGAAGSDVGRRSVSSAINVLSGEQQLRANAQLSANGMVDSRRGSLSQPSPPLVQQQQTNTQQQQRYVNAYNGNNAMPLASAAHDQFQQQLQQQHLRRSLSAGSAPRQHCRDGGALTDPGMGSFSDPFSLPDPRRDGVGSRSGGGRRTGGGGGHFTPEKRLSGTSNGSSRGNLSHQRQGMNRGSNNNNSRGNYSYSGEGVNGRRQGNRRGSGKQRDDYDDGDNNSYVDDDLDPGSYNNDLSASDADTPGNPQLQTHNPRSSAMRRRRQQQIQRQNIGSSRRAARTPTNASGGRGRQRDGWDADGTVHTPRAQTLTARQQASNRNGRASHPRRRRESRYHRKEPSSPHYDENGVEVNSASSYSYSYTTSSDISDYVAGSYFSPVKDRLPRSSGRGNVNVDRGGRRRSPMRGRGRGNGSPSNSPYHLRQQQQQQQQLRSGGAYPRYNSPQRGRGRGGAAALYRGGPARGRGGNTDTNNNKLDPAGGNPPYPYYNSAAPYGRGRGGGSGGAVMGSNVQSANKRAPGGVLGGIDGGVAQSGGAFKAAPPPRQQAQLQQGNNDNNLNTNDLNSPTGSPRQAGTSPAAGTAPGAIPASAANGFVQLPNGMTVPANSPAGRQYRLMVQQQQQQMQMQMQGRYPMGMVPPQPPPQLQQPFGYSPSGGFLPAAPAAAAGRPQPSLSAATSPSRAGRVGSLSVAASNVNAGRSASPGAASSGVHIHPGLLYGSLLPKARPKTAFVVEDDDRGREHSVAPHGDTTHEPFMDPGSVCPVQPAVSSVVPSRTVFNQSQMDLFPVTSAVNGATVNGVQPLAWKSGGSGCVVSRSGHLPPAPTTKLSSHYVPPKSQPPQQRQRQQLVTSIMQTQQHYNPLRQPMVGRQDSAYSLRSELVPQQGAASAVNASQQRYAPLQQQQLEPAHGRSTAERNATLQRFGIAPVQS